MKLYHFPRSSASFRVRIALNVKRLAAELVLVDFRKNEQRSEAFLAKSPSGLVPLLEDDGFQLNQSLSIIQYLDKKYPSPRLIPEVRRKRLSPWRSRWRSAVTFTLSTICGF